MEYLWDTLHTLIVNRGIDLDEPPIPIFHPATWNDDPRPVPWPFYLDARHCCVFFITLILATHLELDTEFFLQHRWLHWTLRTFGKMWLAIGISIVSMLAFEVAGNIIDMYRLRTIEKIRDRLSCWLIERWGWGEVDDDGHALRNADEEFQWSVGRGRGGLLREPIRNTIFGLAGLVFNCFGSLSIETLYVLGLLALSRLVVPFLGYISTALAEFVSNVPTLLSLPVPGQAQLESPTTLFWEFVVPAVLQVGTSGFLYLLVFTNMAWAEETAQRGFGYYNRIPMVFYQLLRAIAGHLLAYTAYQLVCVVLVGTESLFFLGNLYDPLFNDPIVSANSPIVPSFGPIVPKFIGRFRLPNGYFRPDSGRPAAAVLLLIAHWLVKRACSLYVQFIWPYWVPYLTFVTVTTEFGASLTWNNVWRPLLLGDMEILVPEKRVLSRVAMTLLFGLKSTWPARLRLTPVPGLDIDRYNLDDVLL